MIDPGSLLLIAATFAGSKVFHKLADEALESVWLSVKDRLKAFLKREPTPEALTPEIVNQALAGQHDFVESLRKVFSGSSALRRATQQKLLLERARILWIDDHPANNSWERRTLEAFGASFVTAESTSSAVALAARERFDAIISDIGRDVGESGLKDLPRIRSVAPQIPVIFYVGSALPGVPPGSLGLTNDPEELIHLLLDALGRPRA